MVWSDRKAGFRIVACLVVLMLIVPFVSAAVNSTTIPRSPDPNDADRPDMIATLKTHVAYVGETQDARMEGVILYVDNISSGTGVTTLEQIHDDYLVIASSIPLMHTYAEIAKARDDLRVQTQLFSEETKAQMVKYKGSNDAMKPYISMSVNATEDALAAVNASLWLAGDSARLTLFNKDSDNRFLLIRNLGKEGIDTTVMKNISGQIDAQRAGLQAALSNQSADALKTSNTAIKTLNRQFRDNVASARASHEIAMKRDAMMAMK